MVSLLFSADSNFPHSFVLVTMGEENFSILLNKENDLSETVSFVIALGSTTVSATAEGLSEIGEPKIDEDGPVPVR